MTEFDAIWSKFNWIIAEMRVHGMCFFEGLILSVDDDAVRKVVRSLAIEPYSASLELSTWSNDASQAEMSSIYSVDEYIELYRAGRIRTLQVAYNPETNGIKLHLNLMIDTWDDKQVVEIICFREPVLQAGNPKKAVEAALTEFKRLRDLFGGETLFVGPDTFNYPESAEVFPSEWIKIA